MAKISDLLPPPAPISGSEKIPLVQDGDTWGLPLGEFLEDTVAEVTAETLAARDAAHLAREEAAAHALNAQNVVSGAVSNGDAVFVLVRPDGVTAEVYWRGFKDGGASSLTPSTAPKLILAVADPSFDAAGNPTVRSRSIVGTIPFRQSWPNHLLPVDSEDVGGASRVFSLSEPVFAKSKLGFGNSGWLPVVTILSGLYTDNGTGGSGANSTPRTLYAVNMSTKTYPKMVANWAMSGFMRAAGTFNGEVALDNEYGFSGRPYAAMRFRLTDIGGASVLGPVSTDYSASAQVSAIVAPNGQSLNPLVAKASVSSSGLAEGLGTLDMLIYPWLGDEVWDSAREGAIWPTPQVASLPILIDNDGDHAPAFACLDTVSGNNATAVVSTAQATAEATPYLTWAAARAAIRTFNAARGHDDHAGGVILLTQNIAGFGENLSSTVVVGRTWLTVTHRSSVSPRTIGITSSGTRTIANRMAFVGLLLQSSSNTWVLEGADGSVAGSPATYSRFVGSQFTASSATNSTPLLYQIGLIDKIGCTMTNCGPNDLTRFSINRQHHRLHIGTVHTTTSTAQQFLSIWTATGCYFEGMSPVDFTVAAQPIIQTTDGLIHQNCHFMKMRAAAFYSANRTTVRGLSLMQSVYEMIGASAPALSISADGVTLAASNVILRFLTIVGGRMNFLYNEVGTASVLKDGVWQYCLPYQFNCKSDTHDAADANVPNGNRTGNWEPRFGVGCFGNHVTHGSTGSDAGGSTAVPGPLSWLGDYLGLGGTVDSVITFTSNKAAITGDGLGGGVYLPTGDVTVLRNKVAAGRQPCPSDIRGVARKNDGTGSCSAYEVG